MLLANITSFEIQVTSNLTFYATSAFSSHSLLSTVAVIQGVVSGKLLSLGALIPMKLNADLL